MKLRGEGKMTGVRLVPSDICRFRGRAAASGGFVVWKPITSTTKHEGKQRRDIWTRLEQGIGDGSEFEVFVHWMEGEG